MKNQFEDMVMDGRWRRYGKIVIDILLFVFILFIIYNTFMLFPARQVFEKMSITGILPLVAIGEICAFVSTLMSAFIVLYIRRVPFANLGLSFRGKNFLTGIFFVVLLYAAGFAVSLSVGAVEVTSVHFDSSSFFATLVFFWFVAAFEELMVRGFILGRMLDGGINKFVALFISAMIFSLLHIFNPNFAFVPFLNIMLAGFFLGASYIYTRNLCFPIALHWFWNWIQGPVLGYKVSGNDFGYESLLTLRLPEENLINGGEFGFEGSLLCSCLLILGTALIIRYYNKPASDKFSG